MSLVLEGTLRVEAHGGSRWVEPGALFVVSTGARTRRRESNASLSEPLRYVEIRILCEAEFATWTVAPPTTVAGVRVSVGRDFPTFPGVALVLRGEYSVEGVERLLPGFHYVWGFDPMMIYDPETDDALVLGVQPPL